MLVSTNLSSLSAQRMLFENTKAASTAMERLATGSKINKAQDDVAGSAIADRMTSQVRGLNMAVKNVNDAIAMLSVADSAASDITDMLQRMRELAIQAANDTNSAADRQYLQDEVDSLIQEIDRVATQTQYNGQNLLDGSFLGKKIQIGADPKQQQSIDIDNLSFTRPTSVEHVTANERNQAILLASRPTHMQLSSNGRHLVVSSTQLGQGSASGVSVFEYQNDVWELKGETHLYGDLTLTDLSMSGDGNRIAVALGDRTRTQVQVLDWDGSTWQEQTLLARVGSALEAGAPVDLSGDGNTLLIGNPLQGSHLQQGDRKGVADIYRLYDNSWRLYGTVSGTYGGDYFGSEVATSEDGNIASVFAIGGLRFTSYHSPYGMNYGAGYVDTYDLNSGVMGSRISGDERNERFGQTIDLANLGQTLLTFSYSANPMPVMVSDFTNGTWIARGQPLNPGDGTTASFFSDAAITEDGQRVAIFRAGNSETTPSVPTLAIFDWVDSSWRMTTSVDDPQADQSTASFHLSTDGSVVAISSQNEVRTFDLTQPREYKINLNDRSSVNESLKILDEMATLISDERAKIAAGVSRLKYVALGQDSGILAHEAALAGIEDADFATETAALAKAQVLQQSGAAMLAQANARPQLVLQLIK
jgi:flagellin